MKKYHIRSLTKIAILVALLCVASQISIPTPFLVPITVQVLFVALIGYLLSPLEALGCIFVYVAIGALGVPVFANFGGGIATLFGYTGGFIFGFFPLALLSSLGGGKIKILNSIIGTLLCHMLGIFQYALVARVDVFSAACIMSFPYILKDVLLVILAYVFYRLIIKKIKKS